MTQSAQPCQIELLEGARIQQGAKVYMLVFPATVRATPVKNERGMTTGYHFAYHDAPAYVAGVYTRWLRDLPRYALDGVPGLVRRATNKVNGHAVALWHEPDAQLFDPTDGDWITTCDRHGTLCNHRTRALAESHLRWVNWCEACMGGADAGEKPDEKK